MLRSFDYPRHTCLPPIQARISAELEQDESGLEGWKSEGETDDHTLCAGGCTAAGRTGNPRAQAARRLSNPQRKGCCA